MLVKFIVSPWLFCWSLCSQVEDRPLYSEGGFNDFVGINETDPHGPKLINVKHVSKSKHEGKSSDDDFLLFEATVDILDNKMHYRLLISL